MASIRNNQDLNNNQSRLLIRINHSLNPDQRQQHTQQQQQQHQQQRQQQQQQQQQQPKQQHTIRPAATATAATAAQLHGLVAQAQQPPELGLARQLHGTRKLLGRQHPRQQWRQLERGQRHRQRRHGLRLRLQLQSDVSPELGEFPDRQQLQHAHFNACHGHQTIQIGPGLCFYLKWENQNSFRLGF